MVQGRVTAGNVERGFLNGAQHRVQHGRTSSGDQYAALMVGIGTASIARSAQK
jgi:hypothetical protein